MTDHVSDLQWDRLLAGELSDASGESARAHAGGCAICGARLRELTAERDAFRLRPLGFSLAPVPGRWARWRRWLLPIAPVVAAAAAVMVLVFVRAGGPPGIDPELDPDPGPGPDPSGIRIKGTGPVLLLEAGHAGRLTPVATGDVIRAGQSLQAGYTTARDGFGAVLARDGAGTAAAYVPAEGDAMVALPAGVERSFPQRTILDGVVGRERVAIVWCETAQPLGPLLAQLSADQAVAAPRGCAVREVVLDKRAAPP